MSAVSDLVRRMADAGASAELIAIAVEAMEASADQIGARRAADRERKRRQRDRSRDSHVTVTGQSADIPLAPSLPPKPPISPINPYTPSPPKGGSVPTIRLIKPNGFARFWEAYPAKVGKRAAEQAYDRALKRIEGPDPPAVMLAGIERAKASDKWREGYIPNPATWLNQDRWDDEPAPRTESPDGRRPDPPPSAKLQQRHDNYRRAFAGSEIAARARAEQ